jgi:hypothetical protein
MPAVKGAIRRLISLSAVLALAAGLAAIEAVAAVAGGSSGPAGGCNPYVAGTLIPVPCSASSWSGGGSGSGGTAVGGGGGTGVEDVTGAPAATPQLLRVTAFGELRLPHLSPSTAPPRGHRGLVGLPEWFWIAARSWHARTVTVTAGPVWAAVTAAPVGLTFRPGPGLSPVSCNGPGLAYNPHVPSTGQHTNCSYTYLRPSTGQPGNAYPAAVTVTWLVTWRGSGGAGGVLDAALPISVGITVPIAQGEALVTSP